MFPFFFNLAAISLLTFKLSTRCKICSAALYIPALGLIYFLFLLVATIFFRALPSSIKCGGIVWSLGLAIALTYLSQRPCPLCLMAHACHIAIWISWGSHRKQCINNKI